MPRRNLPVHRRKRDPFRKRIAGNYIPPDRLRGAAYDQAVIDEFQQPSEILRDPPADGVPCTCRAAEEGGGHSHGCRYWPADPKRD